MEVTGYYLLPDADGDPFQGWFLDPIPVTAAELAAMSFPDEAVVMWVFDKKIKRG